MAKPSIWQDKFDREREFSVNRPFACNGRSFKAGDAFDKTLVNTRRLRQLYDQRQIDMAPAFSAGVDETPFVPVTNWAELPWLALRKYVADTTSVWPSSKVQAAELMEAHLAKSS